MISLYKNLIMIFLTTFKGIDSPERCASSAQPGYVIVSHCLMCISP